MRTACQRCVSAGSDLEIRADGSGRAWALTPLPIRDSCKPSGVGGLGLWRGRTEKALPPGRSLENSEPSLNVT
jgi:hypothetical protein